MSLNLSLKLLRTRLAALAAAVLTGTAVAVPVPAAADDTLPLFQSGPYSLPYNHCVITLHAADAPIARCGAAAETRAARAGTLLMTWYLDPDYTGDRTDIRSGEGPCDAAGHGVSDIGGYLGWNWNEAISSFRTFSNCAVVEGFAGNNYSGDFRTWVGDTPYLGDDWNDRISSLLVHG
jgi:hypothetical protein